MDRQKNVREWLLKRFHGKANKMGGAMVPVKDLQKNTSRVLRQVEESRKPVFITRHGRPVAVLTFVDEAEFERFVLSNAPRFLNDMREAEQEAKSGELPNWEKVRQQVEASLK